MLVPCQGLSAHQGFHVLHPTSSIRACPQRLALLLLSLQEAVLQRLLRQATALGREMHVTWLRLPPRMAFLTQTRMTLSLPPLSRRLPALYNVKTLPLCPRSTLQSRVDTLRCF